MSDNTNNLLFILNEHNRLIPKKFIMTLTEKYGVKIDIKDMSLFHEALVHPSYTFARDEFFEKNKHKIELTPIADPNMAIPLQKKSYERLEYLGDGVLHCILADYIWTRFGDQQEGFMTQLRTKIENSRKFAKLSKIIGLNQYVLVSRYLEQGDGRNKNDNILEDIFEAFIGALYKNSGYDVCRTFFINLIEEHFDISQILQTEKNFKDILLQYFHKMRWADPVYGTLNVNGPEHNKAFTVFVRWKETPLAEGKIIGHGHGSSKRKAEQDAAKDALIFFHEYNDNDDEGSESYDIME